MHRGVLHTHNARYTSTPMHELGLAVRNSRMKDESMNRLVLTLDAADGNCLYISHGRNKDPVGRMRIVRVRGGQVIVAIEGNEDQLGVYREKALKKTRGSDVVAQMDQRFRN